MGKPTYSSHALSICSLQMVHFRSLDRPKEDDVCLELSKLHTYDDVVERVAHKLNLDDLSKIRLTPHNCYSQQPKPHPIKYRVAEHLQDILVHYNQVELSHPGAELRLLEVFYHKIYKKIENINDQYWTLRAEELV
ncbi:hypothetical protein CTI12_AA386750 [Artemisia annua]|uniref:Ubiquitin carboxyl-terminal hydrolase 7 ICP0-binding domain-containing protein n=1 Tax=Artemisia annua TaxID=35608 RepID=A0A2U1MFA2_ARTAN|nr:hypothetical protein CTI12_AA386750 [Artemisia annua]